MKAINLMIAHMKNPLDTFTGYFLQGLTIGKPLQVCMRQAAVAAALSVAKEGASSSIPCRDEVENTYSLWRKTI